LPITLSLFVGREDELRQIKRRLDHQQLVTLVGQGGMGKTRLSIQAAAELRNEFYHGVVFIPLADIGASELIVSVIAQALRFDFHGQRDPRQQLLDYLRAKKMLLVFDNFEHLLDDGTGLVTEILQEAPQVKLLVTSREQLGLPGESVIELRGLSYPPAHALYADHYSAVQLLQLRAQKKANAPAVTEADHPYVTRICQLVDGLPLGIELAAAWTSTFTYQEIAAEIERNVRFLEDSGRQHGLRAVFEYLWNALLVEEQAVLCKLSLFHGGFRLDAARHIAGAAPFFISALFDKACLVKISANRYALPEVFRQYAEEKFSVRPEAHADAIGSHGRFFMFFLGKLSSELEGIQQPQYLTMISEEISNVRVAWLWAVHGRYLPELQQGLFTLFQYYDIKSLYREGLEMFGQAIEMLGNIETETGEESRGLLLGRLFAYRGTLAARLRLHIPARDDLEKARTIFNELGTSADKAFVVLQLGLLANTFSELDLANTELHTALRLYRDANMQMGTAHALAGLGLNAWSQTRLLDGREHVQQALELYETLGNEREQASMLNLLGNIAWDLGEYQNGQQYYEGSLALSRKLANSSRIAMSLNNLGYTQYLLGQYKLAAQFLLESLKIWEALGDRAGEALSLNNLGFLAYLQENYDQAEVYNRHSLDLRLVLGNIQEIAFSKYVMALVLTARGKYVQARRLSEEALAIFRSQNNPITSANVIAHLAHLAALEENWEQAGLLGTDALTLSRSAGEPHSIIHALNIVGAMQILQQESESARILLIEALGLALPINWAPEILEILGLLGETLQLTGDHEQAARILILVVEHPASSARTRTQAQTHLDRLQPKFDPMDWDVMYKSARDENLENLARRLLQTYTRP
jgi:predicted ATPase